MDILTFDILLAFITLTLLEIVLGIDNLIFITLATAKLPKKLRQKARIFGLSLALVIRVIMLFTLSWIMQLTTPLFYIGDNGFSFKNFLLLFGGLFLIFKSGIELIEEVFWEKDHDKKETVTKEDISKSLISIILQIVLIDFVFSFDSVITAVAMTNNIPVIVTAVMISMIVMVLCSESLNEFLHKYPSLKILALGFIFMIGVMLVSDGINMHISKGYLYFALFFTIAIESLNIIARKRKHN